MTRLLIPAFTEEGLLYLSRKALAEVPLVGLSYGGFDRQSAFFQRRGFMWFGISGVVAELQEPFSSKQRKEFSKKHGESIGANTEGTLAYHITGWDEVSSDEQLEEFMHRVKVGIESEETEDGHPIILTGKPEPSDLRKLSAALKKYNTAIEAGTARCFFAVHYDKVDIPLYDLTRVDFVDALDEDNEAD